MIRVFTPHSLSVSNYLCERLRLCARRRRRCRTGSAETSRSKGWRRKTQICWSITSSYLLPSPPSSTIKNQPHVQRPANAISQLRGRPSIFTATQRRVCCLGLEAAEKIKRKQQKLSRNNPEQTLRDSSGTLNFIQTICFFFYFPRCVRLFPLGSVRHVSTSLSFPCSLSESVSGWS